MNILFRFDSINAAYIILELSLFWSFFVYYSILLMKRNFLHFPKSAPFFAIVAIMIVFLLSFSATTVSAQADVSVAPVPPLSTEDLPQVSEWKNSVDYATVLEAERINAAKVLTDPDSKEPSIALYSGYDRMLSYMQQDILDKLPIEDIAEKNYIKVSAESISDPMLVNMDISDFTALYVALVGMLHQ
jgi:hypothetical protein